MSTRYKVNGNIFNLERYSDGESEIDLLPGGVYLLCKSLFGFYLEKAEDFTLPTKLYGDTTKNAGRIISTFLDRAGTTGVLLQGDKGSGKTLLSKCVSIEAAKIGVPTIIVNNPFKGDDFNEFIQNITQPAIIQVDEFEKVYDEESQTALLTLMDGLFSSKKMFMLTVNDTSKVNSFMRNRPGRIFYSIAFGGVDTDFIREYCQDRLDDKTQIPSVIRLSMMYMRFSFDMLQAVVEEMNRYKETAADAIKLLNAKPEFDASARYTLTVTDAEGKKVRLVEDGDRQVSPMRGLNVEIFTGEFHGEGEDRYEDSIYTRFLPKHIIHVCENTKQVTMQNDEGYTVVLKEFFAKSFNMADIL